MVGENARATGPAAGSQRLALLLAMAMFVLVVDTSLMNVSISAVVHDLDTTVSGVQSAIALEALVSAAFILISSKVGDLIGRKRAYVLGLLAYAVGAAGDDGRPEPDRDHHLLGDHRRTGRIVAAACDAVAHPRELRRRGPQEGLRAGRRVGGDRGRGGTAPRWVRHDVPLVARRVRARGRRDRGGALGHQDGARRRVHRVRAGSTWWARSSRSSAWAASSSASWCGRRVASSCWCSSRSVWSRSARSRGGS